MKIKALLFLFSLSVCCSCNFAPKYSGTNMPMPESFRVDTEDGDFLANGLWWKSLGDEVLDELIQTALKNNKDLQVAMWRVCQYLAQAEVARSSLFPQLSGGGGALKEKVPVNQNFLPLGLSPIIPEYALNLSLSYELDFWGKVRNQSSAAYFEYLAEVENRRTVVLTLIGSTAQSYILLRQLDLQLEMAKKIQKSRGASLQIAKYRFEGGITSEIEVEQAMSVYQEAVAMVQELERKVPVQENLLSILLGQNPGPIPRGKSLKELILPKEVPTGLPVDLLTRRPDIVQAENNLKAACANVGVARAAFFPQFSFASLYGVESLHLKTLLKKPATTWVIGGSLLQEIFTGGSLRGQLKIAQAQKQELIFQYENVILKAFKEVDDALIGLRQSKEVFKADTLQLQALENYLQLAWYRYYEGQNQYLTVLDAERKVFDSELNTAAAQANQFLILVDLYKALGGGWVLEADDHLVQEKK